MIHPHLLRTKIEHKMNYIDAQNFQGERLNLTAHGVEVVENVLSQDELESLRNDMWRWIETMTQKCSAPVKKSDPTTYKSMFELYPKHGMLFQEGSVGHNPVSWKVRTHPHVRDVFETIWDEPDMITSFDGISVSLPCEDTGRGWWRGNEWWHVDQSFLRNDLECIQAFVNLFDVNPGDATLGAWVGSHKLHQKFRDTFEDDLLQKKDISRDWYKFDEDEKDWYMDELGVENVVCVKAKAGSMVLWDSRTVHQGVEPQKTRKERNIRCVPYVCMLPRSRCTEKQLEKRISAFEARRTTSHWPEKSKMFPKVPRTYGGDYPGLVDVDPEDFGIDMNSEVVRRIVGYKMPTKATFTCP
jgi:hypothetical protein